MYNYGYRDYQPEMARFTTVDPVRDGNNWFAYVNNDPVNYVDLWGLLDSDAQGFADALKTKKNKEFAEALNSLVGTPYEWGGKDGDGIDCSGTITYALQKMGYNIPNKSATSMASGNVDWITVNKTVDASKAGETGKLNFYKLDGSDIVNHVNVGVGTTGVPLFLTDPKSQIVDATSGSTLNQRDGLDGQYYKPGEGQVNQTYAPLSTNESSQPTSQATINWSVLERKYKTGGAVK
jgi:hypothetical protein